MPDEGSAAVPGPADAGARSAAGAGPASAGTRSSFRAQPGSHQFQSPSRAASAGTSRARTTVASRRIPVPSAVAITLVSVTGALSTAPETDTKVMATALGTGILLDATVVRIDGPGRQVDLAVA